jgi:hypothetical protein
VPSNDRAWHVWTQVETVRTDLRVSVDLVRMLRHAAEEAERFPLEPQRMHEIIQRFGSMTEAERAAAREELDAINVAITC